MFRVPGNIIGVALGVVAVLLIAVGSIYFVVDAKLNQIYSIPIEGVEVIAKSDSGFIACGSGWGRCS